MKMNIFNIIFHWLVLTVFFNCQEIAARVNQSALEAVTPSPSFQQRHESMRPGRYKCILRQQNLCVQQVQVWLTAIYTTGWQVLWKYYRPSSTTAIHSPLSPSLPISVKAVWAEQVVLALWAQSHHLPFLCSHWMLLSPRTPQSSLT